MNSPSDEIRAILMALGMILVVTGPPMWWYWHSRKPGEPRKKNWRLIGLGFLLLSLDLKPTPGKWTGWLTDVVRVTGACWVIAWGARGSQAKTR